ncbi:hypothetical protein MTO96_013902 [Rhipicephalus appendiculatus]
MIRGAGGTRGKGEPCRRSRGGGVLLPNRAATDPGLQQLGVPYAGALFAMYVAAASPAAVATRNIAAFVGLLGFAARQPGGDRAAIALSAVLGLSSPRSRRLGVYSRKRFAALARRLSAIFCL